MNKENNKNEKTAFEKIQSEQDELTERGKNLLTDIAMTCSNDYAVIDTLAELLELFIVKDSNIMIGDLAESLQVYLFTWTKEHGDSFGNWKESVLTGKKYQQDSTIVETPNEQLQMSDIAKQVSDLLNNPNLPPCLSEAIQEGLTDIYNNANDQSAVNGELKTPEYIEKLLSMAAQSNK